MEKKSNKGLIIVLVIFIIATLSLGSYLTYDKFIAKDDQNNQSQNSSNEKVKETTSNYEDISLYEATTLLSDNWTNFVLDSKKDLSELNDSEKVFIAYENLNGKDVTPKNIEESYFISGKISHTDIKLFGNDDTLYYYNKDDNTYTKNEVESAHGFGGIFADKYLYDFSEKDGKYVLVYYGVYSYQSIGPAIEFYGKYSDALNKNKPLFENPYDSMEAQESFRPSEYIKENFDKYKNNLTKFTYTFEKQNGVIKLVDYKAE